MYSSFGKRRVVAVEVPVGGLRDVVGAHRQLDAEGGGVDDLAPVVADDVQAVLAESVAQQREPILVADDVVLAQKRRHDEEGRERHLLHVAQERGTVARHRRGA